MNLLNNMTAPTIAFWGPYVACKGIFLGGHLYRHLSGSVEKTCSLLGPFGKASFASQASVAMLTALVAYKIMESLLNKTRLEKFPLATKALSLTAGSIAGAVAGNTLTPPVFTFIKYGAFMLALAEGIRAFAFYMVPQNFKGASAQGSTL